MFGKAPHLLWQARDATIAWHGSYLYPDGSILLNFQDNSFPYGSGLVKLDKDSRSSGRSNGTPITTSPSTTMASSGSRRSTIGPRASRSRQSQPWYYEDTILKVSPDGKILDEISVLEALREWPGLTSITYNEDVQVAIRSNDPTHLNNVEPLPRAMAAAFPQFAPGDLLISLRNMNTIAVLDPSYPEDQMGYERPLHSTARSRFPAQRQHHAVRQSGRPERRRGLRP